MKTNNRQAPRGKRRPRNPFAGATTRMPAAADNGRAVLVCDARGNFQTKVNPSRISEILKEPDRFVWLDMQDPHEGDIALLREEFGFHPLALEDAFRPHRAERPKLDAYDGYYFIVFYAITSDAATGHLVTQALGIFIGREYLVTIHDGPMAAVSETIARWRKNQAEFGLNAGALLYALLDTITDEYFPVIDTLAERVEEIEQQIFERFDERAIQQIFALKRDLLAMRRMIAPERDVLNVLIRRDVPIFDRATALYLQDVYDHVVRVVDSIDTYRDLLSSALDAYLSIQSNQLNQIVTVLTIASIVLMSASLIAGIYGMNFEVMPELSWRYGYPFALGLMGLVAIALIIFFRRRRWL